jgi:Domain of unknown function (DUF6089)
MIISKLVVRKFFVLITVFVFYTNSFAQKWEVGLGAGVCQYKGDVMPTFKPLIARPGANTFVRMNYSRSVSFKVQAMIGQVHGDDKLVKTDPLHQSREYSFDATLMEGGGQIEYNFLNFRTNSSRIVSNWTPYVFGGFGLTLVNTKSQSKTDINPSVFSPYSSNKNEQFLALGIGFKKQWQRRGKWNWGVEFGARRANTDFLDNFGYYSDGSYPLSLPPNINPSTEKFKYLIKYQVPNTKVRDMYYYTNFSISYLFYKVHCPNPPR